MEKPSQVERNSHKRLHPILASDGASFSTRIRRPVRRDRAVEPSPTAEITTPIGRIAGKAQHKATKATDPTPMADPDGLINLRSTKVPRHSSRRIVRQA
jgi:hypothetical protein